VLLAFGKQKRQQAIVDGDGARAARALGGLEQERLRLAFGVIDGALDAFDPTTPRSRSPLRRLALH
jgi:hypothetical protein